MKIETPEGNVDVLVDNVDAQVAASHRNDEISAAALLKMDFPPIEYVVPSLIAPGLTLLVAAPKIGKSWLALNLAYQVATGGRVFDSIPVAARPVLYFALEDGYRRLHKRMKHLCFQPTDNLRFITKSADLDADITDFLTLNEKKRPLIIIDTLQKYRETKPVNRSDSAYDRDYAIVGALQRMAIEAECAMLVVHHDRKAAAGDFVQSVSGTNGIAGAADATITIQRGRVQHEGVLSITGRDAEENEYAVEFNDGQWTLQGGSLEQAAGAVVEARAHAQNGDRSNDVLDIVNRSPNGVRPYQVAGILTDMSSNDASKYLKRLAERGLITNPSRGMYMPIS